MLLNASWGKIIKTETGEKKWVLTHEDFYSKKPLSKDELICYQKYIVNKYKKKSQKIKGFKDKFKNNFFNKGEPGEKLGPNFEKLKKIVILPDFIKKYYKNKKDKNSIDENMKKILNDLKKNLHDDHISIIPSFFKVIVYLKKINIEFSIIFKTFGNDLPLIKKEFNYFIKGQHPLYNGKYGSKELIFPKKNEEEFYLMNNEHFGRYFRKSKDFNETCLLKGNHVFEETLENALKKKTKNKLEMFDTFEKIYENKIECLKNNFALGLRDDYNFIKPHLNKGSYEGTGKLFLINSKNENLHEIFFDDNLGEGSKNMVDVWDVDKKVRIPLAECWGKYLVPVDTLQAIVDEDYFIKQIQNIIFV